jgi:replicative DNA helicase
MARRLGICVLALSQISNEAARLREDEAIGYKGSGSLAAVADLALFMRKYQPGNNEMVSEEASQILEVIARKNRHGPCGSFLMRWNEHRSDLKEIT